MIQLVRSRSACWRWCCCRHCAPTWSSLAQATPPDAPNRFVINVQPDQAERLPAEAASDAGVETLRLVPDDPRPPGRSQRQARRARQLQRRPRASAWSTASSTSATAPRLPAHNRITAGTLEAATSRASSERRGGPGRDARAEARRHLRFDIGGQPIEAAITSLRKVDWGSMRANFFVLFPTVVAGRRAGRATSPPSARPTCAGFDNAICCATYPNITVDRHLRRRSRRCRRVLDQVIARGRVPVRLHARGGPGRPVRGGRGDPR